MRTLALILQTLCILFVASGLAVEYWYQADTGFLLITAGTFIFAISVKVTKIRLLRLIKQLINERKTDNE